MSILSDDRAVHIVLHSYGESAEMRISIRCPRAARIIHRSADLYTLVSAAPQIQPALTIVENVAGYSGYDTRLFGNAESGVLTMSIFMPAQRDEYEFKAPDADDALLNSALRYAGGLLCLLNSQKQ